MKKLFAFALAGAMLVGCAAAADPDAGPAGRHHGPPPSRGIGHNDR